jgi:hypothetical protein
VSSNMCSITLPLWPLMTEPVEANCLSCSGVVTFGNRPGFSTCKGCGAKLYLTSSSQLGLIRLEVWKPGGFGREQISDQASPPR